MLTKAIVDRIFDGIDLTIQEREVIFSKLEYVTVKKGQVLLTQAQEIKDQFFVVDGCLRTYYLDESGKEYTLQFAIKDWWISDYIALWTGDQTVLNIECIRNSELVSISQKSLDQLFIEIPKLNAFFRQKLQNAFVRQEKRILSNLTKSAKERYLDFIRVYPDFEKHIKNFHIASYLGITTESLSRIRKDIAQNV
ncbi:Crp/Fnr family transcriptional regulator [uncultured Tenacibaculum sp.]|uniref:Crp/Fnr family transcriptional regulator n=1 Tax=uncultured Tenacibaculum sp. TaxID=174713 RepID=UPI0026315DB4|nr:Crp/Fnr family transcriptional regulator [uncultured Tenacibaculum sp.]